MVTANKAKATAPSKGKGADAGKTENPLRAGDGPDKDPVAEAQAQADLIIANAEKAAAETAEAAEEAAKDVVAAGTEAAEKAIVEANETADRITSDAEAGKKDVEPDKEPKTLAELGQVTTPAPSKPAPEKSDSPVTVRAIKRGYYDQIREEGEVFEIRCLKDMGKWMEVVNAGHPAEAAADGSGDNQESPGNTGNANVI